jgi:hypothetical protein
MTAQRRRNLEFVGEVADFADFAAGDLRMVRIAGLVLAVLYVGS